MEEKKNIMDYDTVSLDDENSAVVIIDQTKLPGTTEIIALKTAQEIWDAIYLLQVRGAPAIGVAAAYGIYVLAKGIDTDNYDAFYAEFKKQKEYLDSSRPTAAADQRISPCHWKKCLYGAQYRQPIPGTQHFFRNTAIGWFIGRNFYTECPDAGDSACIRKT